MRLTFVLLLSVSSFAAFAQALPGSSDAFPWSWIGIWRGDLHIYNQQNEATVLPMELQLLPLDSAGQYTWTIIYNEDREAGLRAYTLKTIDAEAGHYLIDERNSIMLEAYLIHHTLYSRFAVMDNLLLSAVEKRGDELIYEIIAGSATPVGTSGDTVTTAGDTIPPVQSFPVRVLQRAVLQKQ